MSVSEGWVVRDVPVDQMAAAAGHLTRNWGEYGYRLGVEATYIPSGVSVFLCSHSDGSRFRFVMDRWGNAYDIPEIFDTTLDVAIDHYSSEMKTRAGR